MADPIQHGKLFVPYEVELRGEWLTWKIPENTNAASWVSCTDRTLVKFAKLETADHILQFARRYGVFGAKEVAPELPRGLLNNELRLNEAGPRWCVSMRAGLMSDTEPVSLWFMLIRQARAMLRIAADLKGRRRDRIVSPGSAEDWTALGCGPIESSDESSFSVRDAQLFLVRAVNDWLRIGQVSLQLGLTQLSRTQLKWTVEVGYGDFQYNLFGQLAFQLFLLVASDGKDKLYVCSACQYPYLRDKKAPRAGQNNFCIDCSDVAQQRAVQKYKEKIKTMTSKGKKHV